MGGLSPLVLLFRNLRTRRAPGTLAAAHDAHAAMTGALDGTRRSSSLLPSRPPLLLAAAHHRVGSEMLTRLLRALCRRHQRFAPHQVRCLIDAETSSGQQGHVNESALARLFDRHGLRLFSSGRWSLGLCRVVSCYTLTCRIYISYLGASSGRLEKRGARAVCDKKLFTPLGTATTRRTRAHRRDPTKPSSHGPKPALDLHQHRHTRAAELTVRCMPLVHTRRRLRGAAI